MYSVSVKMEDPSAYSGGLTISREMRRILDQPRKYIGCLNGAQQLKTMYVDGINGSFDPTKFSRFAQCCLTGQLDQVKYLIETNSVPNLKGKETPYEWSYATILVYGAQRTPDPRAPYAETLSYILEKGVPTDSQDITGMTALHHVFVSAVQEPPINILRILINHGANIDHQDRCGDVPLMTAIGRNFIKGTDVLLECGADLDIPDADGATPRFCYTYGAPQVTAIVTKWIRKRAGEAKLPREGGARECDATGCASGADGKEVDLKSCSRCKIARYCSAICQKKAWPTHKMTCKPFDSTTTVVLKPTFIPPKDGVNPTYPFASIARESVGTNPGEVIPEREYRRTQVPREMGKSVVIKVQASKMVRAGKKGDGNELYIYTKKRDMVCRVLWIEQTNARMRADYDKIVHVVRTKGMVGLEGMKAYFVAELKSKEELVVKISDVLAEQPF